MLYCPLKEVFLYRNSQLGPGKVSVVMRCPLRTVRFIEIPYKDFIRNQSVPEKVSSGMRCPL